MPLPVPEPEPTARPWHTVPRSQVLFCTGMKRDRVRGLIRCAHPLVRAAVRGVLRWRRTLETPERNLMHLWTTIRCPDCGSVYELDFQSHPPAPRVQGPHAER